MASRPTEVGNAEEHHAGMYSVAAGARDRAVNGVFINEWQLELISSHSVRKRTSPKTEVPLKVL